MRGLTANIMGLSSSVALIVDGVPTLRGQGFDYSRRVSNGWKCCAARSPRCTGAMPRPGSSASSRASRATILMLWFPPRDRQREKRALRFDASQALVKDTLYLGVLAGEFFKQDGFIDNVFKGHKEDDRERRNGRLVLRWTPGDRTDATLRYAQRHYRDAGSLWGAVTAPRALTVVRSGTDSWNQLDGAHRIAGRIARPGTRPAPALNYGKQRIYRPHQARHRLHAAGYFECQP